MPAASKGEYDRARERTKAGTNPTGSSGGSGGRDGGFFSAGKQFVESVKNTFGGGPSAGRTFTDPKTGKSYKEPEYKPMTFKGLTSKDPANVARNRALAAQHGNKYDPFKDNSGKKTWFDVAKDRTKKTEEAAEEKPNLAQIGAPTTPVGSPEIATPAYGLPSLVQPASTYAQAFYPMQPTPSLQFDVYGNPLPLTYMDIFGTYPDFLPKA